MKKTHQRGGSAEHPHRQADRGFALIEVIVSSVIAVVAVIGLAYSFSVGRVQIDRFEVARAALAAAQEQMERLSILPGSDPNLNIGQHPATPKAFIYDGASGWQTWTVEWFDDPETSDTKDLKRVTVRVAWIQGALRDTIQLSRLFSRL